MKKGEIFPVDVLSKALERTLTNSIYMSLSGMKQMNSKEY